MQRVCKAEVFSISPSSAALLCGRSKSQLHRLVTAVNLPFKLKFLNSEVFDELYYFFPCQTTCRSWISVNCQGLSFKMHVKFCLQVMGEASQLSCFLVSNIGGYHAPHPRDHGPLVHWTCAVKERMGCLFHLVTAFCASKTWKFSFSLSPTLNHCSSFYDLPCIRLYIFTSWLW